MSRERVTMIYEYRCYGCGRVSWSRVKPQPHKLIQRVSSCPSCRRPLMARTATGRSAPQDRM